MQGNSCKTHCFSFICTSINSR